MTRNALRGLVSAACMLVAFASGTLAHAASHLSFPADANGGQGQTVVVALSASPADSIDSLDMTVTFDPAILEVVAGSDVTVAGIAQTAGLQLAANVSTPGVVTIGMYSTDQSLSGSGEIVHIAFHVLGAPSTHTALGFGPVSVNEGGGSVSLTPGTFTVTCAGSPDGVSCNDGNACTQSDICQAGVCVGTTPVVCAPQDSCHTGVCNPSNGTCSQTVNADGSSCTDGDSCTQTDTCQSGVCVGSNPVVCTASDQCHVAGTCNPGTGTCSNPTANDGTACDDGNACTQTDTCQAGVCTGDNPVVCTASDQCHVAGICNPSTGTCSNPNASNGTACNDGNACTQTDTCQSGVCTGTNPVVCTASDQCHVAGTCNPSTGTCSNPAASDGTACNDGNACTQTDTCQSGVCTGSNPVVCTASDQCHVAGVCNPGTGTCSNPNANDGTACNDGNACTQTDTCQSGVCAGSNPVVCTASDQCHVAGTCNPSTGTCSNPAAGNGTACNDGNACSQTDTCQSGVCVGSNPVVCTPSDQCHVAGTCDPSTGTCSNPAANDGTSCNDGNGCTQIDTCQSGVCTGSNPVVCTASDQCHVAGVCNPSSGTCSNPAANDGTACNDGNACTQTDSCQAGVCTGSNPVVCTASDQCHVAGTCNPSTGTCSNPAAANGAACNDGNGCTQTDTCQSGVCVGGNPVVCTASDQCHLAGTCNPGTGTCSNPTANDGTACNDGNGCTQTDTCQSGVCTGSNPIVCTASDQCHVAGTCNPGTGTCSNPNASDGTACNDGNACTQSDSCQSGVCTGSIPVVCTASDQCHVAGTCNPSTGVCSDPTITDGTTCVSGSGDQCATSHSCQAGVCVGGNPVVCTASDQCHLVGTCNPGTGICSNPVKPNGASCTDGNACTQTDTCQSGTCTGSNPLVCNDNNPCTTDVCNHLTGCVYTPDDSNVCSDGDVCTTDHCSAGSCLHTTSGVCGLGGNIFYYRDDTGSGFEPSTKGVPAQGIDRTGDAIADATTGSSGSYVLGALSGNVSITTVSKYGSPRIADANGAITGLDASFIARGSIGLLTLSPNQALAGDVTGNGTLSALDAAEVARYAVQLVDHFDVATATGSDWKFLRCDNYLFPGNPGCGAPIYTFTPVTQARTDVNFYAILYGDVSGNWRPPSAFATDSSLTLEEQKAAAADASVAAKFRKESPVEVQRSAGAAPAELSISGSSAPMRPGERRQLTINLRDADGILGLDLALNYDPARVAIVNVGTTGIATGYAAAVATEAGQTRLAVYGLLPLSGSGQAVTVTIEALQATVRGVPVTISGKANEGAIPMRVRGSKFDNRETPVSRGE